jgi:hypothetical protein
MLLNEVQSGSLCPHVPNVENPECSEGLQNSHSSNIHPVSFIYYFSELIYVCTLNTYHEVILKIPMILYRLDVLGIKVLIDRLVLRRQYALAIKIAEFLKLRETQGRSRILAHWACYKVC